MTNLSTNANQMLEGFFADNTDNQTNITQEILQKEEFDIDKVSASQIFSTLLVHWQYLNQI